MFYLNKFFDICRFIKDTDKLGTINKDKGNLFTIVKRYTFLYALFVVVVVVVCN